MRKAIFVRHVAAVKGDEEQRLTPLGQFVACAMGLVFKLLNDWPYTSVKTTPQLRGVRTASYILAAQFADPPFGDPTIIIDRRLNDFSSDPRPEIAAPLKAAVAMAKSLGIDVEAAIYAIAGGLNAVRLKAHEAMECIAEVVKAEGCHLFAGIHGGTIDQLYWMFASQLNPSLEEGPGCKGGIFLHAEGFVVDFDGEGHPTNVEIVRQPPWLKAAIATFPK